MRAPAFALAAALLLAPGCGGDGGEGGTPVISEEERRLGAEQHPLLLAEFGGGMESGEAAYVAALGERIAGAAGLGEQCRFTLVNSDVINAFAVPGCYIYVTRGLLSIVNSEAELASVLAHEVGHIVADHGERQQKRSIWRSIGVFAVGLITGSERLTRVAGRAAEYFTLRYSRKQEYESDDLGIRFLKAAGYDPFAATDMLAALGRQEQYLARTRGRDEARSIPEWVRTHPLTENRIERARAGAAATGVEDDALPENEAGYLNQVDGLLYGDDPQQGFVMGRRFAHPVMRIAFEAPPGFTLTNSPQAILIEGPDGLRGEFAGGRLGPGGLEEYTSALLRQMLGQARATVAGSRASRVNGVPALVTDLQVETPQGPAQLSVAAYGAPGGSAYHFLMVSQPGSVPPEAVASLFASFSMLSEDEVRTLRPRVIRVAVARAGDSLRSLAARMASDHPMEHLLMLNGRSADQPLRPGERLKIVAFAD